MDEIIFFSHSTQEKWERRKTQPNEMNGITLPAM